jgi:hypothetical protein
MTASFSLKYCDNSGSSSEYDRSSSCVRLRCCREFSRRAISSNGLPGVVGWLVGVLVSSYYCHLMIREAEPSVIVAGSNFRASESEKGCGCLGRYSMMH